MKAARAIVGSALVYAATNALVGLVPIGLLPLLTRELTPTEYGIVAMFTVFMQMMGLIAGLSVHGAVGMRYFDRDELDFPRFVGTCVIILVASVVAMFVLVGLLSPILERIIGIPRKWLLIAVIASAFAFMAQVRLAIWQSEKRPVPFAILRSTQAGMDIGLSLLFVLALGLAWQGRTGGIALALFISGTLALVSLRHGGWIRFSFDKEYARRALTFGVPLIPHALGGFLVTTVDRIMITNIFDIASTGVYMVAVQIGMLVLLVADAFARAASPWLIETLKENDPRKDLAIVRATYLYFVAILGFSLLVGLSVPPVLAFIAGPEYSQASTIVPYLAIGQAIGGLYLIMSNYVFYSGRTGRLAAISLLSGLINLGLSYTLLPTLGLRGAAVAFIAGQTAMFLGTWWLAARWRPMPWFRVRCG